MKKSALWIALLLLCLSAAFLAVLRLTDAGAPVAPPEGGESGEAPRSGRVELRLLGEGELLLDYGERCADPGAEAWIFYDNGEKEPLEIVASGEIDATRPGTTEIEYYAVKDGETLGSVSRRVTVRDGEPPVITLLDEPGERDYTAFDKVDGDLTERLERVELDDRFVYTVSDASGNEARAERVKQPQLVFPDGERVQLPADYRYQEPRLIARDMYGRDLSGRVQVEGAVIPWKTGVYELNYTVSDDFGNSASATRTVEIVPVEMPETELKDKVIYLTFDDGPAEPTEALLDMLAKYDAKVTFFVTNTDPRYVDLIGRAYREGHSIGLHAYVHDASRIYANEAGYFHYFNLMQELIHAQTGEYTRIVRFVGGSSNTSSMYFCPGVMTALAADLTAMGYRYYDWNIQPENDQNDVQRAYNNMVANCVYLCEEGLAPPIALQHDTGAWSIQVAELVIRWGLENGYRFEGIDETTPEVHHVIRN